MSYTTSTTIKGPSRGDPDVIHQWAKAKGCARPDDVKRYLDTLSKLCRSAGMRFEVLVAQAIHEATEDGIPWNSYWWKERCNCIGMGITGDPAQNAASVDFRTGDRVARAHAAHAWLYSVGTSLPTGLSKQDDPRWDAAIEAGYAGIAPTMAGYTNRYGIDAGYADKWVARLNALDAAGLLTAPSTTTTPAPKPAGDTPVPTTTPTSYAPAKVKQYLKDAIGKNLVVRNADGVFFLVNADVVAVRTTPRLQEPSDTALRIGGDLNAGEPAHADWAWVDAAGKLWLYSNWNTVFKGEDFAPKGAPIVLPDPEPTPTPDKPIDLSKITAATYKLVDDPAVLLPSNLEWIGTSNFFANRSGAGDPLAIIYHCTDDLVLSNTISWFQDGSSNASSHFVIARDGKVYQFVSSKDGAWTNGDYNQYRTDIPWLVETIRSGVNVNNRTISYEFVATPSTPPTEAQYVSAIALSRYFCHPKVYGIATDRGHQMRHADINSVSRSYCPGPNFDLERIIKELGGDPTKMA